MSLLTQFETEQLRSILRTSNYWATFNRNRYPEQIQNAIDNIYQWVECSCNDDCECKNHGCTHHLIRNHDVKFDKLYSHFLNCYVDVRAHDVVREGRTKGRGSNAVIATDYIRTMWEIIQAEEVRGFQKSLICTNWECKPFINISESFQPAGENIYLAKWLSLLSLGTYIAYDNSSVGLLNRDFDNPRTYRELIRKIRGDLITHLTENQINITDFCLSDNPSEFFQNIPVNNPRPIGNILDKLYLVL